MARENKKTRAPETGTGISGGISTGMSIFGWASACLDLLGRASQFVQRIQNSIEAGKEARRLLNVRAANYGMRNDTVSLQAYFEIMAGRNVDDDTANAVLRELKIRMLDENKFKEEMEKWGIRGKELSSLKDPVAAFSKIMEKAEAAKDVASFLHYVQEKLKIKNDELSFMFTDADKEQGAFIRELENWKTQKELADILRERERKFLRALAKSIVERGHGDLQEEYEARQPQFAAEQKTIIGDWNDPEKREKIRAEHARENANGAPPPADGRNLLEGPHQIRMRISDAPHPDLPGSAPAGQAAPPASPPGDSVALMLQSFGDRFFAWAENAAGALDRVQDASASLPAQLLPVVSDSSSRMLAKLDEILGHAREPRAEYHITANTTNQQLPQPDNTQDWVRWVAAATSSGVA